MAVAAVRFDASTDKYSRSATGLGASNFTVCCWVKLQVDRNAFGAIIGCDNGGSGYNSFGVNASGTALGVFTTGGDLFQTAGTFDLVVGTWTFVARVFTVGSTGHIYMAPSGAGSLTEAVNPPGGTTSLNDAWSFFIGTDGFGSNWMNASIAAVKVWTAALTAAELLAEMPYYSPVRTSNLWANYTFYNGPQTNDESGNGRTLTVGGTLTTDTAGPPITLSPSGNHYVETGLSVPVAVAVTATDTYTTHHKIETGLSITALATVTGTDLRHTRFVGAVSFDGTLDRYTRSASGLVLATTSISWCCWAKLRTDRDAYGIALASDNGTGGGGVGVRFGAASNGTQFFLTGNTGGGVSSSFNFTLGTWTFIAASIDLTGTDPWVYHCEAPGTTLTGDFMFALPVGFVDTNTFSIGQSGIGFSNDWFDGSLAQVKVWTAKLSQAELEAEMYADHLVRTANAWAYYSFRNGPQTNDESGNSRTLTINGTIDSDPDGPFVGPVRYSDLGLSVGVAATITATDILHRKELALSVPATAAITPTDLLHSKELGRSVVVGATVAVTDLLHLAEPNLFVTAATVTTGTDVLHRSGHNNYDETGRSVTATVTATCIDIYHTTVGDGGWQVAVDSGSLTTMQAWYAANTGYLSQGWLESQMWGSASGDITINAAWLTTNAAAGKVVNDGGGHWTVTGFQCRYLTVQVSNLTLKHCHVDMGGFWSGYGIFVIDPVTGAEDDCSNVGIRCEYCTFESGGVFWITNKQLTANVATLTYTKGSLSTPLLTVGKTLEIRIGDPVFDANVEAGGSRVTITAVTPTTFSYARTHANVASTPVTTTGAFATTAIEGNYGDVMYYNPSPTAATYDGMVFDHCVGKDWRAAFMFNMGATANYCWVPSLTFYGADPHNTSSSIRGKKCRLYRNLFEVGTSSAVSLYADYYPYSDWDVTENIMHAVTDYEVNFPLRGTGWSPLENGFRRELVGNYFERGLVDDTSYFTKTFANKLFNGTPAPYLMDEGSPRVVGEPVLLKSCWNIFGGGPQEFLDTWAFTPSPNSTLFVFAGIVNGGTSTVQTPSVSVVGQFPQTFTAVANSPLQNAPGNDALHGMRLWLYKAETGANTSFEHIRFDAYTGTQQAWICFWVYEVTGVTGMNLVHSSVKTAVSVDTITSNALSAAAANGNLSMAFAAASVDARGVMSNQAGWFKTGTVDTVYADGNLAVTGALYWRKDFTGTTFTISDLGNSVEVSGVVLTEYTIPGAPTGVRYIETGLSVLVTATVTRTDQADYKTLFPPQVFVTASLAVTDVFTHSGFYVEAWRPIDIVATADVPTNTLGNREPLLAIPITSSDASVANKLGIRELGMSSTVAVGVTSTDRARFRQPTATAPVVASITSTNVLKLRETAPLAFGVTATTTSIINQADFKEPVLSVPVTAVVTHTDNQSSPGHYDETRRPVVVGATTVITDQAHFKESLLGTSVSSSVASVDLSRERENCAVAVVATTTATNLLHRRETVSVPVAAMVRTVDQSHSKEALRVNVVATVTYVGTQRHLTENRSISAAATFTCTDTQVALGLLAISITATIGVNVFQPETGIVISNADVVAVGAETATKVYAGDDHIWTLV